jgi:hypothetical protein
MADSRHSPGDKPGDDKNASSPFDAVSSPTKPRKSANGDDGDDGDDTLPYSPSVDSRPVLSADDSAFLDQWAAQ